MDKEEAINCIQDLIDVANCHGSAYVYKSNGGIGRLKNVLDCLVNSEPVDHARWARKRDRTDHLYYYCSKCGLPVRYFWEQSNYCPHCGAKMDKVSE